MSRVVFSVEDPSEVVECTIAGFRVCTVFLSGHAVKQTRFGKQNNG